MEVVKVYQEKLPEAKLVGKRYTNHDRDESGTFAGKWRQWIQEGRFDILKQCKLISETRDDMLAAMRAGDSGDFEYWIGVFLAPDAEVPLGYDSTIIPAGEIGVCWIYGSEKSGELYSREASALTMDALTEKGWNLAEKGWFLERYNHPRFTIPDEKGNVILDICAYLG